jgi:NTP pyrophosphatase (non-canonical NTP hydrolase)
MTEPTADRGEPSVADLAAEVRAFVLARGWRRYHNPKNLALALAGETGEVCAELQWRTADEAAAIAGDPERRDALAGELADVAIYLLRLADELDVDLAAAVRAKLEVNEDRFPAP